MSRGELHHHRFLERTAIRVTIATLWQTGYTINENVRVRAGKPDERCKKGAISNGPERARISWGRAMRGRGSGGGTYLIALGSYLDTFAYPSQSGNERRPESSYNGS